MKVMKLSDFMALPTPQRAALQLEWARKSVVRKKRKAFQREIQWNIETMREALRPKDNQL